MLNIKFTYSLIKGKISEIIFSQMIRSTGSYTILEFGYEKTLPILAQMHPKNDASAEVLETIRRAPDFTIINNETREVYLIEVKYMNKLTSSRVLKVAKLMQKSWKNAALFLATPEDFYFDTVEDIVENKGEIKPFRHPKISQDNQAKYLDLVNTFIPKS